MDNFDKCLDSFKYVSDEAQLKKHTQNDCCEDNKNYVDYDGCIVCNVCNKIISNILENPEWKNYGNSGVNSTRCGLPVNALLPKSSIGSCVFANGRGKNMYKIKQYQKWNEMPYAERSLYKIFADIKDICNTNNIPSIIAETACSIYTIISKTKISRGNNRKGIIAACLYFACKECSVPRSTQEIASIFDIKVSIVTKGCKLVHELINKDKKHRNRLNNHIITLEDFIERFSFKLNIDEKDVLEINKIALKSKELNLITDNTPPSMAAGCIYLYVKLNDMKITKKNISEICKISEVTINKCYRKLEESLILNKV